MSLKSSKLYLVEASVELLHDKWDVYSSFVVCCLNEQEARETHPSCGREVPFDRARECWVQDNGNTRGSNKRDAGGWVLGKDIDKLAVTLLGTSVKGLKTEIVCASFHAG